jgi:hypothetical protein
MLAAVVALASGCISSTGADNSTAPVTVTTGLDPAFSILTAGGIDRIYAFFPNDPASRALAAMSANGSIAWSFVVPSCAAGSRCAPVVDALGNVYITTTQGLMSRKGSDGGLRWTNNAASFVSIAAGSTGRVYAIDRPFLTQSAYALDGATGSVLWKTALPAPDGLPVVIDEARSNMYVGGRGGPTALDLQTGAIKWRVTHSCIGGGETAIASDGTVYVTCDSDFTSKLYAYDPSGVEKWSASLGSTEGTFTPLIDAAGNIYASNSGSVTSLSPAGAVNWRLENLTQNFVEPALDTDGNVFIIAKLTSDAAWNLLAVRNGMVFSNDGEIDPTYAGALLLAPNGRVYYNANGNLISLGTGGADAASQWVQFGRDYSRSSRR